MALPILDGNQTSTTLATTVSGGEHYPVHIIDSGTISVGSIPAVMLLGSNGDQIDQEGAFIPVGGTYGNPIAISGTVTVSSLPDGIAFGQQIAEGYDNYGGAPVAVVASVNLPVSGAVTISNLINASGGANIKGLPVVLLDDVGHPVFDGSSVPATIVNSLPSGTNRIGSVTASLSAGTAQIGSVTASISGTPTVTMGAISGTVTANVASTTVTVSALPSGALTTRFGSVTTANTAQITTAVTNTSRKYLLAQNISVGTVTIGIGFSPTTTQGIQLTAGAGLTFDSFVPTGAVYWLGATTGATWTILEG